MDHAEFAEKWRSGKLQLTLHKTFAHRAAQSGLLPPAYRRSQNLYLGVGFGGLFAAGLAVLMAWWAGMLAMLVLIILLHGIRKRASKTIEAALAENETLYNFAQYNELISFRSQP